MDQKTTMENLARAAYEKGGFNGAWLYAEKGKILIFIQFFLLKYMPKPAAFRFRPVLASMRMYALPGSLRETKGLSH